MNMRSPVKRSYDPTRRRQAAEARKSRILRAAHRLFELDGYQSTTMDRVAKEAEVSVETVYGVFGSKAKLLARVIEVALVGDEAPVAVAERSWTLEVRDETNQARQLDLLARNTRNILERAGSIQWAAIMASDHEAEIEALVTRNQKTRLRIQTEFISWVAARGEFRDGLTVEEAGQRYWILAAVEIHHLLRKSMGWSALRYERWLAESLKAQLLPPQRLR
jgi:AcrR family transcriptional regulator